MCVASSGACYEMLPLLRPGEMPEGKHRDHAAPRDDGYYAGVRVLVGKTPMLLGPDGARVYVRREAK